VLEAAAVYSDGPVLTAEAFAPRRAPERARKAPEEAPSDDVPEDLARVEAWAIARSLRRHRGNVAAAARALGIGRATLYRKMAEYGLAPAR